ncbi:MAG: hypothetical protein ACREI9_15470, partial [Nitrospiraceae bacterium]
HYQRDPAFAEQLRRMVTERKALLARQLKPRLALPEKTPEMLRLEESARPYGADISLEGGRVTLRHAGQPIRDFRTTADAETWLKALETGEAAPLDPTRLLASMRQQLMTEGTIRGWHGTSAERAEQVLAKGFHPLNRDTEVLKAIEDAGIGAQQWKTLPKSLRDNIRPSFAAISQERSKVHFTSDPAYAAEYSALGGEFYQEALVRTRMVKTALDHGYTPNEGDNMMQIIGYLNRNTLHVPTAEIKDPLRRSVVAADIKVSPAERQILLGQLDALLVAPPKDEQGTIDALSKLFTEIRVVPKDVKIRRMTQDPQNTLRTWENLPIEGGVNNVQELRMLAHSRAMVVDYDGAALNVTNQMTGETIRGLDSLKEAAEAIRSAPNVAVVAREIGPQVPGAPPLPGAGSLHGLSSEQPPPFCPLLSTE